jgi:hypothetical protein
MVKQAVQCFICSFGRVLFYAAHRTAFQWSGNTDEIYIRHTKLDRKWTPTWCHVALTQVTSPHVLSWSSSLSFYIYIYIYIESNNGDWRTSKTTCDERSESLFMHGRNENTYKTLAWKLQRKGPFVTPRPRREDKVKINLIFCEMFWDAYNNTGSTMTVVGRLLNNEPQTIWKEAVVE